jgi:hypothetical protein
MRSTALLTPHSVGVIASFVTLVVAGSLYPGHLATMLGAALLSALVLGPVAIRAGFRYGARRGVEAAIETMTEADYRSDPAMSSGDPSAER